MKIQPIYSINFTRKPKKSEEDQVSNPIKNNFPNFNVVEAGPYSFYEESDSRKFFADYDRYLQNSSIVHENGFDVYRIEKEDCRGEVFQTAQIVFDNVVITNFKQSGKESDFFKAGKKYKTIVYDLGENIKQKIMYSEENENIIDSIDEYDKKGKIKRTTFYDHLSQIEHLEIPTEFGFCKTETIYSRDNKRPRKVLNFDEQGNTISEISYYTSGSIKKVVERKEDLGKVVLLYRADGSKDEMTEYGPTGKVISITSFNGLGNIKDKLEFDQDGKVMAKYINNDFGEPTKMLEYNPKKGLVIETSYHTSGTVKEIKTVKMDYEDFEELN